jgi:hypothetical protein
MNCLSLQTGKNVKLYYRNIIHPLALLFLFAGTVFGQAPDAPTLLSPENGATDIDTAITLLWEAVADADDYDIQVSTSNDFESYVENVTGETGSSYDISGLDYSQTYYWRVRASNEDGDSDWSDIWSATTVTPPTYTISVSANPTEGGTVSGDGAFEQGSRITVTATANTGYTFVNWTVDGTQVSTDAHYTFTVTDNRDLVANFTVSQYTISVSANPTGGGTVSGGGTYTHGQTVNLQASPATGYTFVNWTEGGSEVSANANYSFTATGNRTLVANFAANQYTLTINTSGNGSVSKNPDQTSYTHGTEVQLTANAATGWSFNSWSGALTGSTNPATLTMDGNKSVTANFTETPPATPTLSSPANGATGVSIMPRLTWNPASRASSYRIQIASSDNGSVPIIDIGSIPDTYFDFEERNEDELEFGTGYNWSVQAANAGGTSDWSVDWNFQTEEDTYTVTGTVSGATQADVTINVSGDITSSTNTATDGSYTISDIPQGSSITLTPSKTGYTFSPTSLSIPNITSDQSGQNFTASLNTYSISGNVSVGGSGLGGVTMTATGGHSTSVQTASNGNYTISGIPHGVNVTITPTLTGYSFDPPNRTHNNVTANLTGQNFDATLNTYSISGNVNVGGTGLGGVTMTATGGHSTSVQTASNGNYTISGIPHGVNVTITPTLTGYSFDPPNRTHNNVTANLTGQNFTATLNTYSISGTVSVGGSGLGGVTMTATGGHSTSVQTASNGNYTISGIPHGVNVTITPTLTGYSFDPPNRAHNNVTANLTGQNFDATLNTYSISGNVNVGGTGFGGVTMTATGGHSTSVQTASNGNYTISGIPHGVNVTITPTLTGYSFDPPNRAHNNVTANLTGQNFDATPNTYSISGNVNVGGTGLGGVTMTATGGHSTSVQTASNGNYTISGIPHGVNVTITPTLTGYSFDPPNRTHNNVTANLTGQNFTATLNTYSISGTVTTGGSGFGGVTITASGGHTQTVTTNSNGQYTLTGVQHGSNVTVTPSRVDYTFNPTSTNVNNISTNTTGIDFTGTIVAPATPTLAAPENNATNVSVTPTLSWNAADRAQTYQVQVSTASNFGTTLVNQSGITTTSYDVTTALQNNTQYYWRVRASNAGGESDWSTARTFTTIIAAPAVPTLAAPENNATNVSVTPTLSWNAADRAQTYQVQVSTASNFGTTLVNQSGITTTSYDVTTALQNNTQYYWRVRASNAGGESDWSTARTFTTIIAAPATPTLVSPANNATGISTTPTLSWNTADRATTYQVQISTVSNFNTTVVDEDNISTTSYTVVTPLQNSTQYYWRVKAINIGGESNWSAARTFTTIIAAPAAPLLVSPVDEATNVEINPTFEWNAVATATEYQLQVAPDQNFSPPTVNETGLTTTTHTYTGTSISNNSTYYWRVRASNSGGNGEWSEVRKFTTIIARPATPTLAFPPNNATGQPTTLTVEWNAAARAETYHVQVALTSAFTTPVVNDSGLTVLTRELVDLETGTQYYWRVRAKNVGGISDWSTVRNFTTITEATVVTSASTNVRDISATLNGSITNLGSPSPTQHGFVWSTTPNPTIDLPTRSELGPRTTTGSFTSDIIGLLPNTVYYVRAYVTNEAGTSYGEQIEFTTTTATKLVITQQPVDTPAGAPMPIVRVEAHDDNDNITTSFTGTVTVALENNPEGAALQGTLSKAAVNGVVSFNDLRIFIAGEDYTLKVTATNLTEDISDPFDITPGSATKLVFHQQPANKVAGQLFSPPVEVHALDAFNNIATGFGGQISLGFQNNPTDAALDGQTTMNAVNGIAQFTDINIKKVGTGYTLRAIAPTLTEAISVSFNITPGPASKLIMTPISAQLVGAPFDVTVTLNDQYDNLVPNQGTSTVNLTVDQGSGTLSGQTSGSIPSGQSAVTITDVIYNIEDTNVRLRATGSGGSAAGLSVVSNPFEVSSTIITLTENASDHVVGGQVTLTATVTGLGQEPVPDVGVRFRILEGNGTFEGDPQQTTNANGTVSIIYNLHTTVETAKLRAELQANQNINDDVDIVSVPGIATDLEFSVHPSNARAGENIAPPIEVTAYDRFGNVARFFNGNVTVTIANNPGGGSLAGTTTRTASNGRVTFNDLWINKTATGYTLSASASGVNPATSDPFTINVNDPSALLKVSGDGQDGFINAPLDEPFVVRVTDEYDNPISGITVLFEITGIPSGATGQSLSNETDVTDENGDAGTILTLGNINEPYTVTANAAGTNSVTFTTAAGGTHRVIGRVTEAGNGLQSVSVTVSWGSTSLSQLTNLNGDYNIGGIPHGATNVKVTPTRTGYRFAPADTTIAGPVTGNIANVNFVTTPPFAPVLDSPENNATDLSTSFTLRWNAAERANHYRVQVAESQNFSSGIVLDQNEIVATQHNVSGLEYGKRYYWRVSATNASGTGPWTTAWNFTVIPTGTHTISLRAGWNLVSSFMEPLDSTTASVFESIGDNLIIVKDGTGRTYFPALGVDDIGHWNYSRGYQIYLSPDADDLEIFGIQRKPDSTPIHLLAGWNMIGYIRTDQVDVVSALNSIESNLIIAKNGSGQVYLPAGIIGEDPINTMGTMKPGEGYQMYLTGQSELLYPPYSVLPQQDIAGGTNVSQTAEQVIVEPQRYIVEGNTGTNAVLIVTSEELLAGDEIGVRTPAGMLTGNGVVRTPGRAAVTVWGNNLQQPDSISGALEGEMLALFHWSAKDRQERNLIVHNVTDIINGTSSTGGIVFTSDAVVAATVEIEYEIPETFELYQNYPNPFNPTTTFRYALPKDGRVVLEVYNLLGQRVRTLVDDEHRAGTYEVVFDGSDLSSGTYFYRIHTPDYTAVRKFILLK